jgi:hypothetical protein
MMKKLAVTVFVVSLAAIGCGSDSGTPDKKDSGTSDTPTTQTDGPGAKLDVMVPSDVPMKQDMAPDMADKVDQQGMDGAGMDGGMMDGGTEVDGGMIDGGDEDTAMGIDGGMMDAEPMDTGAVDMGAKG